VALLCWLVVVSLKISVVIGYLRPIAKQDENALLYIELQSIRLVITTVYRIKEK
jgi:hypothetical protein